METDQMLVDMFLTNGAVLPHKNNSAGEFPIENRPDVSVGTLSPHLQVRYFDLKIKKIKAQRYVEKFLNTENYQGALEAYQELSREFASIEAKALQSKPRVGLNEALLDEIIFIERELAYFNNIRLSESTAEIDEFLRREQNVYQSELAELVSQAKGDMPDKQFMNEKDLYHYEQLTAEISALNQHLRKFRRSNKPRDLINRRARKEEERKPLKDIAEKAKALQAKQRRVESGIIDGLNSLTKRQPLIQNSKILGAVLKAEGGGQAKFDSLTGLTIVSPPDYFPYLALQDGTVIIWPGAPSDRDLDIYKKYRLEKNGKLLTRDDVKFSDSEIFPPHNRGYTLGIYAEYNTPGVGGPTLRGFLLRKDGYFKSTNTRMLSTQLDILSGTFGRNVTQNDMSGTYFVDGNTIELQHNNGTVERKLFGTDGSKKLLIGSTEYRVPK